MLHNGHFAFFYSHWSIQPLWKWWMHWSIRNYSPSTNSIMQIRHSSLSMFSYPQFLKLSFLNSIIGRAYKILSRFLGYYWISPNPSIIIISPLIPLWCLLLFMFITWFCRMILIEFNPCSPFLSWGRLLIGYWLNSLLSFVIWYCYLILLFPP